MSFQPVRRSVGLDLRLALDSGFTKLYLLFEITPFDVCFILKFALGWRPASHQEDAEQKLLSAPLLLVAIETQGGDGIQESFGGELGGCTEARRDGTDGSDHRVPVF